MTWNGVTKALSVSVALGVLAFALVRYNRVSPPSGPVPVVWDREVCQRCKMHVGDPRFAAQLQTAQGHVFNFDDPGCLLDYVHEHDEGSVHVVYFRDHAGNGWLSDDEVGFLPADDSPMGYGIRAVPKELPGARAIDWARAKAMRGRGQLDGGS